MGSSIQALMPESLAAGIFLLLSVAGFKKNLWLISAGLAGHGVFDFIPWSGFCLSFDELAAGFLSIPQKRRSGLASLSRN